MGVVVVVEIVVVVKSTLTNFPVLSTMLFNGVVDSFADESRENEDEEGKEEESEDDNDPETNPE